MSDLYERFQFAKNDAIHMIKIGKFFPKPWLSVDLAVSQNRRETVYRKFQNSKSPHNFVC